MRARRTAATAAGVLIGGVALTGCGLIGELTGSGGPDIDFTTVQLHPTGEIGLWLDPGYVGGIGEAISVPGNACGVAEGVLAVEDNGAVVGYDVATGTEAWRVVGACTGLERAAGDLYLARLTADGSEYVQIDIATGGEQVFYAAPIAIAQTKTVGRSDDAVYLHADADVGPALMSFALDGTLRWQAPIDIAQDCSFLGDHIGCRDFAGTFTVLDAATGEVTIPQTTLGPDTELIWTSGGYTIVSAGITTDAETTTIHDFSGVEIGTVEDARLPLTPAPTLGVTYSLEDLQAAASSWVWLTDAEGRSLVHWDSSLRLSASGAELPKDAMLLAGAADGSTVLYSEYVASTVTLMTSDGTVLHTFEGGEADAAQILDGLIVESAFVDSMTTTVYLPAG